MSLKLHGLGKITGIDQGLSVVGVTTLHNELSVSGDVVVGGGLTVTGVLTYEDVTNVDSIGIITARSGIVGDLTGNVTGDITGNIAGTSAIAGISSSITDTAVDIFVYDTSKDSDGGAWRKRTQHTSWYNETLNTATRGSRREFPAVAVIVVETGQVTIYDGDDPDLPMWMVFNGTAGGASHNLLVNTGTFCLSALNGTVFMGALAIYVNFISEYSRGHRSSGGSLYWNGPYKGNIAERNAGKGSTQLGDKLILGGSNDVAMTVLQSAPTDSATGLPVPTIAVGTGNGASIIKDDGSVYDITNSNSGYNYVTQIKIDEKLVYIGFGASGSYIGGIGYAVPIPGADVSLGSIINATSESVFRWSLNSTSGSGGQSDYFINPSDSNADDVTGTVLTKRGMSFGTETGMSILLNEERGTNGSVAYATTSYNTGYMHGDIKGAFLSDTDTTDSNADTLNSGNAFDGTFASSTGWTADADWSISGGVATCNGNNSGRFLYPTTDRWPIGSSVVVEVTVTAYTSGTLSVSYATGGATSGTNMTATGTYKFVNVTSGNDLIYFRSESFVGSIDNVKIYYAESDRSVSNNGLIPYGTVTKSAVATGAELVAYSGFSNNNVLVQPYNSNLNPGTGNYSFMCWFKCSSTGAEQILMRRFGVPTVTGGTMMRIVSSSSVIQWYVRDTSSSATAVNSTMALDDGNWHCAVGTREGSTAKLYIDGELNSTSGCSANSHDPGTTADLVIGAEEVSSSPGTYQNPADLTSLALVRYSLSAPTAAQVKKMYEDEKFLFQENAKCTLYGSSDAVTALGYDEDTELLHVGTSSGRSDFQGLRRINNTTTAVTTAISASDDLIAEQ